MTMTADITNPIFTNETKARKHLEALRWPDGPFCPHCGSTENIKKLEGKSHRPGLHQCNSCREHFTVTVGTLFERSHIPLHKWLLAFHLMSASKKGISSHQLHRMLGITYKSAWFMTHRIREAMNTPNNTPMGGHGKIVEADETFFGNIRGKEKRAGYQHKNKIFTLVERDGKARSFHVETVTAKTLKPIIRRNVRRDSHMMTDEHAAYRGLGNRFLSHESVRHTANEYVRGNAHTNTVEGYFSILKRGLIGTYHHVGSQHLARYMNEFDFRYNNRTALGVTDSERTDKALMGIEGKRLTYRRTNTEMEKTP
jgi:transposase-like protein